MVGFEDPFTAGAAEMIVFETHAECISGCPAANE